MFGKYIHVHELNIVTLLSYFYALYWPNMWGQNKMVNYCLPITQRLELCRSRRRWWLCLPSGRCPPGLKWPWLCSKNRRPWRYGFEATITTPLDKWLVLLQSNVNGRSCVMSIVMILVFGLMLQRIRYFRFTVLTKLWITVLHLSYAFKNDFYLILMYMTNGYLSCLSFCASIVVLYGIIINCFDFQKQFTQKCN